MIDWLPILLSLKLAFITTLILLITGVPIAYGLSEYRGRLKPVLESVISLPMVLPPSVLGFYLLMTFSPVSFVGSFFQKYLDIKLVFSFEGLVVSSILYSLPFMIHPLQSGFQAIPPSLKEASYTLGISKLRTFTKVILPTIRPALLSGIALTFAHTMGEFGVILMIGGNIPGVTRVASIAVYDEVEKMNYGMANIYSFVLITISFLALLILYIFNKKPVKTL